MPAVGKEVHIDAPHLLTQRRRVTDTLVTALMWVVYSYLWAPFISLIAWLLGIEFAYDVMVRAGGAEGLVDVLIFYGIVLACIVVVVTGWSGINRYRFANRQRRQLINDTSDEQISEYFALGPGDLDRMRDSRIAILSIDPAGGIDGVQVLLQESERD